VGGALEDTPLDRGLVDDLKTSAAGFVGWLLADGRGLAAAFVDHLNAQPVVEHVDPELDLPLAVLVGVGDHLAGDKQRRLAGLIGHCATPQ
jgi:hypothetical protein